MKRRVALKNMATAVGGLAVALPAWASGWSKASVLVEPAYLSFKQEEMLAEVVETIIPATDTPGAKELHVHSFIQKMVTDCYEQDVQQNLVKGLSTVGEMAMQKFKKPFIGCDTTERIAILNQMETSGKAEEKDFYSLIKELTIQGYLSSEYVMVKHSNYQMVPGHYYGCVPVSSK